ncbi:hypothetical protein MRX96_015968 [Rhipicephalus microplus]
MALATCRRRQHVAGECCSDARPTEGLRGCAFDSQKVATRLAEFSPWHAPADGTMADGLPCTAAVDRNSREASRGGEDGPRFTHVPPRNNRRDDIAEVGPQAATSLADAGRRSGRHEKDAIGRTDRKY